ncbi:MAG TPA: TlpA disulfide reductase family protein [Polyangia bacterium]|nr:TlpA disulfide reductase family protein [Polyangia bacterium]
MTTRAPARRVLIGVVSLAVAIGVVAGTAALRAANSPGSRTSTPTGAPVAPAPREGSSAAPASGAPPGYVLLDLPAIQRAVHGHGRPLLVHFWASWCGPCIEELPLVDTFARDMKARGVDVLSLSLDDPARAGAHVVEVLTHRAPSLTRNIVHVEDPDAFINAIDSKWEGSIPAVFAYDGRGQLRGRLIGEASRRDLDALVARVAKPVR